MTTPADAGADRPPTSSAEMESSPCSGVLNVDECVKFLSICSSASDISSHSPSLFPGLPSEVRDAVSCSEAVLRLYLEQPNDALLTAMMPQIRASLRDLRESRNVSLSKSGYPQVLVLDDLLVFRDTLIRHPNISPEKRRTLFLAVAELLNAVECPQYRELQAEVRRSIASGTIADHAQFIKLIETAARATPFGFADEMRTMLRSACIEFREPEGVLVPSLCDSPAPSGPSLQNAEDRGTAKTAEDKSDDTSTFVVGTPGSDASPVHVNRKRHREGGRISSPPVAPATKVASQVAVVIRDGERCISKYHMKYSTPDKHCSRACPYCSVCHLMEMLFNGCTEDCAWKHAPTIRKISQHLTRFPSEKNLALTRLSKLQRGEKLEPMDVPL